MVRRVHPPGTLALSIAIGNVTDPERHKLFYDIAALTCARGGDILVKLDGEDWLGTDPR